MDKCPLFCFIPQEADQMHFEIFISKKNGPIILDCIAWDFYIIREQAAKLSKLNCSNFQIWPVSPAEKFSLW